MTDQSHVRRRPPGRPPGRPGGGAPPRWRPGAGWRDLLIGRDPEVVLARIAEDDPLDLRRLCAIRLRSAAVLVDPDRVHLRALSLVAFTATTDGAPDRRRALVTLVDRAVEEVVADAPLEGLAHDAERAAAVFSTFASPLQLDSSALARACEAFNACAFEERAAFFALVVDRCDLDGAARGAGSTPVEFARAARRALDATLSAAGAAERAGAVAPADAEDAGRGALEVSDGGR